MSEDEFKALTGFDPVEDDLERANCVSAGQIGHTYCGICQCGKPRFTCGHHPDFSLISTHHYPIRNAMSEKTLTDRELLELAAKAAGIHRDEAGYIAPNSMPINWNPLTDDGDEARLEAALSLAVEWDEIGVTVGGIVTSDGDIIGGEFEPYHNHPDKQAARRRAGVRAAAAIATQSTTT